MKFVCDVNLHIDVFLCVKFLCDVNLHTDAFCPRTLSPTHPLVTMPPYALARRHSLTIAIQNSQIKNYAVRQALCDTECVHPFYLIADLEIYHSLCWMFCSNTEWREDSHRICGIHKIRGKNEEISHC